jgi:hypothetical protein
MTTTIIEMAMKIPFDCFYNLFCLMLRQLKFYMARCVEIFEKSSFRRGKASYLVDMYGNALKLSSGKVGTIGSVFSTVNDSKLPKNIGTVWMTVKEMKKEQMYDR